MTWRRDEAMPTAAPPSAPPAARRRFVRFSEMGPEWVNREMHLHTSYTDGRPTVAEVVRRAEELGLEEIAFTEHVRRDSEWFHGFADEVRRAAAAAGGALRVLVGAEVRITDFDGSLDITPELRRECDVLLASVHRFPGPGGAPLDFARVPREEFAAIEYRTALGLVRRGGADVLAHPGGMSQRHLGGFPDEAYLSLMEESVQTRVAIEISSSYLRDVPAFLGLLGRVDPLVSVGSDAHGLEELGRCRDVLRGCL